MRIRIDRKEEWYKSAKDKIEAIYEARAEQDKAFEEQWAANYDKLPWICRWGRKREPSKDKTRFYSLKGEPYFYPSMAYERQLDFCEKFVKMLEKNDRLISEITITEDEARMLR